MRAASAASESETSEAFILPWSRFQALFETEESVRECSGKDTTWDSADFHFGAYIYIYHLDNLKLEFLYNALV